MSSDYERFYARGTLSIEQIEAEINKFWRDMEKSDAETLELELQTASFDGLVQGRAELEHAITVQASASGADPTAVLVIITFAPSANRIVKDVWETAILPRIKRRWGEDAVGAEERSRNQ
jgi:hypothetical protein